LAFSYVATYLYAQDAPLAERRAQALTLDRALLRELLGEVEIRDLIDPAVLEAVEAHLQHTAHARRARNADELHDVLRRLGDLSPDELDARASEATEPWVKTLLHQRRAIAGRIAGEQRIIAADDAGRYRDALGLMPPGGLPERFLQADDAPLVGLIRRFARHRGPFTAACAAARFGLLPAQIEPALQLLHSDGTLAHGEMRPGGTQAEWCDVTVLRRLKRETLAKARQAVAAVDGRALTQFLPHWHGLGAPGRGLAALEACIVQLEGAALPFSVLCQSILPARVADFHLDMLDMLCASGQIVWVGHGALGPKDGRVRLLRRTEAAAWLAPPAPLEAPQPLHAAILAHLERRGACFTVELKQACGTASLETLEGALWDLVWSGHITNDTLQPLRGLTGRRSASGRRGRGAPAFGGRWSEVAGLIDPEVSPTQRAYARAQSLLQRYGIVSREAVAAEDLTGGFAAVYPILKSMEEAGRVRRGYFVEGLGGLQFAYGGAIERLRAQHDQAERLGAAPAEALLLAAVDPANPFGTLLPWPSPTPNTAAAAGETPSDASTRKLRRVPNSHVVLAGGDLLFYLEANGHHIVTFCPLWQAGALHPAAMPALRRLARQAKRGRSLHLRGIDGVPTLQHPKVSLLVAAGGVLSFDGITIEAFAHGAS
jgi:ATP-dependent Lhr-like helicase